MSLAMSTNPTYSGLITTGVWGVCHTYTWSLYNTSGHRNDAWWNSQKTMWNHAHGKIQTIGLSK